MASRTVILATGSYVPVHEIKNEELAHLFPASRLPLIEQKTGVRARRHAAADEATSDLAAAAAFVCLRNSQLAATDVDAILLATSSPDRLLSATAARVQHLIGATNAMACDINAVCTGSLYALTLADSLLCAGRARRILVIAAEVYSRFLNPRDFSTYPYFGDGAGAVLLTRTETDGDSGLQECLLRADGAGFDTIQIPAGGARLPCSQMTRPADAFFAMNGREVYEFAVRRGSEIVQQLLGEARLAPSEIAAVITHQANINIIRQISEKTAIPRERFFVNLDRLGNTAGASVLLALAEWRATGGGKPGDNLVLVAFGGGLTWGACRYRF